ncbi:hypothetical protein AAG747_17870 [Rapidithrix thailandica]|uniref:MarR family transcriptional regulator n=1 Tax=Rapidithrix thailandica TaxID=413964 RepID=A0AAW9S110_9BACT
MNYQLNEQQLQLVERIVTVLEQDNTSPAIAGIVALLLVSPCREMTIDEIQEQLQLSKSSTNHAINILLQAGMLSYGHKLLARKRYYRLEVRAWRDFLLKKLKRQKKLNELLSEVIEQRPEETHEFNKHLIDLVNLMEQLHTSSIQLLKK